MGFDAILLDFGGVYVQDGDLLTRFDLILIEFGAILMDFGAM